LVAELDEASPGSDSDLLLDEVGDDVRLRGIVDEERVEFRRSDAVAASRFARAVAVSRLATRWLCGTAAMPA
jgi:hypothetical protein